MELLYLSILSTMSQEVPYIEGQYIKVLEDYPVGTCFFPREGELLEYRPLGSKTRGQLKAYRLCQVVEVNYMVEDERKVGIILIYRLLPDLYGYEDIWERGKIKRLRLSENGTRIEEFEECQSDISRNNPFNDSRISVCQRVNEDT